MTMARSQVMAADPPCGRRPGSTGPEHAKQLATEASTMDAYDGIPHRPETELLENRARDVATSRTTHRLNEQACDVHDASWVERSVDASDRDTHERHTRLVRRLAVLSP
jgi:hypothetical protein